ncbi:MAG: hypothetical protein QW241_09100 [Candidatus Bathyarchaeia archaeon]
MRRYRSISLKEELVRRVEEAVRKYAYNSIADFVSEATREKLQNLGLLPGGKE